MTDSAALAPSHPARPQWIEESLPMNPGRDPLGLMTITEDRIMPILLPGVLALSRRARYFSFYPFLLDEYASTGLRSTRQALSSFIKRREYEFAVAAHLCTNCDVRAANGAINASRAVRDNPRAYKRAESVESTLGGYGLYYRTPGRDACSGPAMRQLQSRSTCSRATLALARSPISSERR